MWRVSPLSLSNPFDLFKIGRLQNRESFVSARSQTGKRDQKL